MHDADVIVIGAGVLGVFHAYFAAQHGYRTLLLERNAFPADASTRNFGLIAPSIVPLGTEWAAYARDTVAIYQMLQQECDVSIRVAGSLYVASSEAERRVLEEFGPAAPDWTSTYLDRDEACYRYPILRESYVQGALLFPDDLTLEPRQMLLRLITYLTRKDAFTYRPHTTVVAVEASGEGCLVRDARGAVFRADRVIVCSGAEVHTLFPDLLADSGVRLCKLQMMQTVTQPAATLPHALLSGLSIRRYPAFQICRSFPLLDREPVETYLREHGIHLVMTQSFDGGIVIGDSHRYGAVTDAADLEVSRDAMIDAAMLAYARRMVTLPSWRIGRRWDGYYLTHPEQEIIIAERGAIHLATGIGGKGMTTGPGFARHNVARLLT